MSQGPFIEARYYNGAATCGWRGERAGGADGEACANPARWMPVLVFIANGYRETDSTRVPAGILSLGICDVHRDAAGEDLFDRVEWVEIARSV